MGDSNYLLSTFEERLSALENVTAEQKQSYISQNHELLSSSILPAYEHLVSALTKLKGSGKNTKGLCNLPNGKDYYAYLVSRDTGSPHTVEEIQKRIYAQISSRQLPPKIQLSLGKLPSLTTFRRLLSYRIWSKILLMHFQNLQMSPRGLNMSQTHWNHT